MCGSPSSVGVPGVLASPYRGGRPGLGGSQTRQAGLLFPEALAQTRSRTGARQDLAVCPGARGARSPRYRNRGLQTPRDPEKLAQVGRVLEEGRQLDCMMVTVGRGWRVGKERPGDGWGQPWPSAAAPASASPYALRKARIELEKGRWKGGRGGGGRGGARLGGPARGSGYRKQKWPGGL